MPGHHCGEEDRFQRCSLHPGRSVHSPWYSGAHPVRQRAGVLCQGGSCELRYEWTDHRGLVRVEQQDQNGDEAGVRFQVLQVPAHCHLPRRRKDQHLVSPSMLKRTRNALSFIKLPPLDLKLKDGEVHIWFGALDQAVSEMDRFIHSLSIDERMRAGRFHFQKDRKRFIVRHGMLRMILGQYLSVEACELRFYQGKNGKPAITETFGNGTIQFNLSHSNEIALFAFTRGREIGVDIEYIHDISEMEQIAERFFSIKENEVFRSLPKNQKREAFFKGWTCKEAFVKALGDGLSWPLDKFDVSLVPGEPANLSRIEGDSRERSRWSIQNLNPAPDYVGAFAVKSRIAEIKCWRWEII